MEGSHKKSLFTVLSIFDFITKNWTERHHSIGVITIMLGAISKSLSVRKRELHSYMALDLLIVRVQSVFCEIGAERDSIIKIL